MRIGESDRLPDRSLRAQFRTTARNHRANLLCDSIGQAASSSQKGVPQTTVGSGTAFGVGPDTAATAARVELAEALHAPLTLTSDAVLIRGRVAEFESPDVLFCACENGREPRKHRRTPVL
jgi:hypothetical protein